MNENNAITTPSQPEQARRASIKKWINRALYPFLFGTASAITVYYAFMAGDKSEIFKHLLHKRDSQGLNIGTGAVFAVCNLIINTVLGKGGLSDFMKAIKNVHNIREATLFAAKMLLGGAANLPTAYLTYITLKDLEVLPIAARWPVAISAAVFNGGFYAMLNTTGLSLNNIRNFNQEEQVNKWIKRSIIPFILGAAAVTAIPSALNGGRFINDIIVENKTLSDAFAIVLLIVNAAFLANANLPVYQALASSIGKKYFSRREEPAENQKWNAATILKLLGMFFFCLFASSSAPTIFRDTAKGYGNSAILNAGEAISMMVICFLYSYYLGRIVFPPEERTCPAPARIEEVEETNPLVTTTDHNTPPHYGTAGSPLSRDSAADTSKAPVERTITENPWINNKEPESSPVSLSADS